MSNANTDKHTPGPWSAIIVGTNDYDDCDVYDILDANGVRVADTVYGANARLIAQAPKMLEALEALIKAEEEYGDPSNAAINEVLYPAKALLASLNGAA